jgi:phenylacetate-coenzyme A ligase PaaK-like adenylate-forming protein
MTPKRVAHFQDELVREQVRAVGSGAAFWQRRFGELGRSPSTIGNGRQLATVPAVGERDVSPTGDPAAMAGLVIHGGEGHFVAHTSGAQLRHAMKLRLTDTSAYRRVVEAETRPTSFAWSGLGFRYPVASTRGDLDVLARTGARLWSVLGLTRQDALLAALPLQPTSELLALQHAALAAGSPALFPGNDAESLVAAARLAPPTVLAVPHAQPQETVELLADAQPSLSTLTTLLLVGMPTEAERAQAQQALAAAGATQAVVLAVHVPSGARLAWGECRQSQGSSGLHTYPDHDLVQVVDPETGEESSGWGEVVLTQLGLRGTALLRWRTGDLTHGVDASPCPGCRRVVPRVTGLVSRALVVPTEHGRALDLRSLAGALTGRPDIADWRVVVGGRDRDGRGQVVVHVDAGDDPGPATVGVAADIRTAAGMLPSQLVAASAAGLAALDGQPVTRRILRR